MPNFAKLSEIVVPENRQRRNMDKKKLQELVEDIASKGLLHPVVLRPDKTLVAGARRLAAIGELYKEGRSFTCDNKDVPLNFVPYLLFDADEIGLREAELSENIFREDLSWQDRCSALDELHRLRQELNPNQSVSDTAREVASGDPSKVHSARMDISKALIVKPFLDDPEVAHANSIGKAFLLVSRRLESEFTKGHKFKSKHTLIVSDILDAELPKQKFSCVIADPQYGIEADNFGDAAQSVHLYDDSKKAAMLTIVSIMLRTVEVCTSDAHLYMFCDIDLFLTIREIASQHGWKPFRTPIIWNKKQGHIPGLKYFRRVSELILFATRDGRGLSFNEADIIEESPPKDRVVAAQKPVSLYTRLLKLSCSPGDYVLDPCCGSGTIFKAADLVGVTAFGVEKDPRPAALAQQALQGDFNLE